VSVEATRATVLVLAKAPLPGRSKTRLIPAFGTQGAAALAVAALADTLDAVRSCATDRVLVLDGSPSDLVDPVDTTGFRLLPQVGADHGERITAAFETVGGAAVLVGMDTPQLDPALLTLDLTAPVDAWFGPAEDGGWWALGLRHARRDARRVLSGVPMSTGHTGSVTRDRLQRLGLRVTELPVLRDVDEEADARAVARSAPGTHFAGCLRELLDRRAPAGHAG